MGIFFDVLVSAALALGIGLEMGGGWGALSFVISILVMLTISEMQQGVDSAGVFILSVIKDAASLGATIFLSEIISMALAAISKLRENDGARAVDEGGQLKEIGKAINDGALENSGDMLERHGENLVESAQSLEQFNDFYGLSPMAIALISYFLAKALYVLYLIVKKQK